MCGICGYLSKKRILDESLEMIRDMMHHRGPDDAGASTIEVNDYYIGLAHRRLSIIDLSENGHQPMFSPDERVSIVFNGEIYNHKELKKQLTDYPFKSESDTEVLIAAYLKWGPAFIEKCNGMFAVAILDRKESCLYLYRDRMGQKPLYYFFDYEELVFASELKPIMLFPNITLDIDYSVLGRYLVKQCIASPETIYKKVYKLEPGSMLSIKIQEQLQIQKERYWSLNQVYKNTHDSFQGNFKDAKKSLFGELERAINYRMEADVPVGILLSGGYDSSLVAAIAQRNRKDRIKTFSIGIKDSVLDEAVFAKKIADNIGTEHHELYISLDDMLTMVDSIPKYYDEPFADSSQIATMLVSKMARQEVTVALTGDGGDELFAGYPIYHDERSAQFLDPLGKVVKAVVGHTELYNKLPYSVRMVADNVNKNTKTQFNYKIKADTAWKMLSFNSDLCANYNEESIPGNDWRIKRMLLDAQTYLPDDLHCKVDRASMMFSLEARSPFMDVNVVELALSMPERFKLRGKCSKRILKEIAWEMIPRDLLDRPKSGFEVPIDSWMRNELKEELLELSKESYLSSQGVFNPQDTQRIVAEFLESKNVVRRGEKISSVIWSFYMFQKWFKKYMN